MYCNRDVTDLICLERLFFLPFPTDPLTYLPPILHISQQRINWVYLVLKTSSWASFSKETKSVPSKLSQCCFPCCCFWKCSVLSLQILQNEKNWKHLNRRLSTVEIRLHVPRLPRLFCKQEDMFIRVVNHIHVIYCQDYLRFPKKNSNELYRNGCLERERDDLYPGKQKNPAKSRLSSNTHSSRT